MTNWLPLALLTALCLAGYNFFIKLAADSLPPAVGAVVLQLVAAGLGAAWLLRLKLLGQPLAVSGKGLGLAALAGLSVGLADDCGRLGAAGGAAGPGSAARKPLAGAAGWAGAGGGGHWAAGAGVGGRFWEASFRNCSQLEKLNFFP